MLKYFDPFAHSHILFSSAGKILLAGALCALIAAPVMAQSTLKKAGKPVLKKNSGVVLKRAPRVELKGPPEGVTVERAGNSALGGGSPGEVQSAVVPPDTKSACPNGRLLISNDAKKNPGLVHRFDLSADGVPAPQSVGVTPEALPDPSNQGIFSNDHDLVTLDNGDVLLLKMGRSKGALSPKPVWFDSTFKLGGCDERVGSCSSIWGPGARSASYIWRSEDCGNTFTLRSVIDTADVNDGWGSRNDGSGALPQKMRGYPDGVAFAPGSSSQPVWQMGGTDGPTAKVDPATGRVLYGFGIYGRTPDPNASNFSLSSGFVRRSVVMMSDDRGDSWTEATTLPFSGWRHQIEPLPGNRLAISPHANVECTQGSSEKCLIVYRTQIGSNLNPSSEPDEGETTQTPAGAQWANNDVKKGEDRALVVGDQPTRISANIFRHVLMTKGPGEAELLLGWHQRVPDNGGFGYGLRLIYADGKTLNLPQIKPAYSNPNSFILHPTAVGTGFGPVLLYWYDVNAGNEKIMVRGRIIIDDAAYTSDFNISSPFDFPTSNMWFGDYISAGAFERLPKMKRLQKRSYKLTRLSRSNPRNFEYYPIWKQSDSKIHYAKISYRTPDGSITDAALNQLKEKAKAQPEYAPPSFNKLDLERY